MTADVNKYVLDEKKSWIVFTGPLCPVLFWTISVTSRPFFQWAALVLSHLLIFKEPGYVPF